MAAVSKQNDEIERLSRFIERFKAKASKAAQARSRQKQLDRMERISIDPTMRTIRMKFPVASASGPVPFEAEEISKVYGDQMIFSKGSFSLAAGDRCVITGPNGAGKTTLLRILLGIEKPTSGEVRLGHNVRIGYFAQYEEPSAEEMGKTLVEVLKTAHPKASDLEIRTILGAMLFSDDDAFKTYGVLSGGERSRVRLCRVLLTACNVVVLDEPTNHLDVISKDLLLQALDTFTGTVILVSHDRDFVESVATRVIQVKDHRITEYPGGWDYYLHKLEDDRKRSRNEEKSEGKGKASLAKPNRAEAKAQEPTRSESRAKADAPAAIVSGAADKSVTATADNDYEAKKEKEKQRRKDEKRRQEILQRIEHLEQQISAFDAELCLEEVFASPMELKRVTQEKQSSQDEMEKLMSEWEGLEDRLGG